MGKHESGSVEANGRYPGDWEMVSTHRYAQRKQRNGGKLCGVLKVRKVNCTPIATEQCPLIAGLWQIAKFADLWISLENTSKDFLARMKCSPCPAIQTFPVWRGKLLHCSSSLLFFNPPSQRLGVC